MVSRFYKVKPGIWLDLSLIGYSYDRTNGAAVGYGRYVICKPDGTQLHDTNSAEDADAIMAAANVYMSSIQGE